LRVVTSRKMFIVTLEDHPDGVYSVFDEQEDRVIPIFQEEDDADRYLMMLQEDVDYPPMQIVEVDDHVIIGACQERGHRFSIITPDDLLIPPDDIE
jgi:acetone carboxylase gamma subunit